MRYSTIAFTATLVAMPFALSADTHQPAWQLFGSSYADTVLNPPTGEDSDFFITTGGVPNLMFLLDTSGSMVRMPPDGASGGWGTFQDSSHISGSDKGYGCVNAYASALRFHSPCGTLVKEGQPYSASTDWASEKDANNQYCPYMINGNQDPATNKPGFDPDFYCGSGTSCGTNPNFFDKDRIFHDVLGTGGGTYDGWDDGAAKPNSNVNQSTFCSNKAGGNTTKENSCNTCLTNQGYWFDGSYASAGYSCGATSDCDRHNAGTCVRDSTGLEYNGANNGSAHCSHPHVWFKGNFLNFYPPKFLMARKVLKDVLMAVRKVRLGLTVFAGSDGGTLVDGLNPGCNMLGTPSQFDSNRTSVKNHLNDKNKVSFNTTTPLAETLLNIGQLYTTRTLNWFSSSYQNSGFQDGSASSNTKSVCYSCQQSSVLIITDGLPNRDGKIPGSQSSDPTTAMTLAISNQGRNGNPGTIVYAGNNNYNITGIGADCPVCNTTAEQADTSIAHGSCSGQQASGACDDSGNPIPAYLPKVAWYLHNVDTRSETEVGADNFQLIGKQTINAYTIGIGTDGNAALILQHAATAGGGLYNGGMDGSVVDAQSLKKAIEKTLEDVNTRSTGFGAAALSPLQAAASQGVLIPRFEPARAAHWNGHLYGYQLYSEFSSGDNTIPGFFPCFIPTSGPSGPTNGDYDCDGKCYSVFLMDANASQPAFIMENGSGQFVRNFPYNRASCGFGNQCSAANCATASSTLATPSWDTGDRLAAVDFTASPPTAKSDAGSSSPTSFTGWQSRNVYTVVDSNGDGKITAADTLINLRDLDTDVTLTDKVMPYLNIRGSTFCGDLASRLIAANNTAVGTTIKTEIGSGNYRTCTRTILLYVRGADIFNELANYTTGSGTTATCTTWPTTYCTRPYQLGDIFHSSPVEVHPPSISSGILCDSGLDPQCLPALYRTVTSGPSVGSQANAYDDYAKNDRYHYRDKFALVGANDGLLHAIHTARYDSGAQTWVETDSSGQKIAGDEIWAFLPPDLLAKLPLFMGSMHQFFVDATPMVRDVWIDGYANALTGSATNPVVKDDAKQGGEFHTVAVTGERRGGTHYFALDVTDASRNLDSAPKFLWIYPQPNDAEQLSFGNTWADFTPTPPPIGPVRLDRGSTPCAGNLNTYDGGGGPRCYEERWVVMLAGGFDPQYTKGRGVHMVDAGDGTEIFDFSQPAGAANSCDTTQDPRCHLQYPIAATVGMMAWGINDTFLGNDPNGYFFDTATFGDTGGQVWVLRFNEPGRRNPAGTGKVTNWYGARMFQQNKAGAPSCGLDYCGSQPFFHIAANVPLSMNGKYHVLLGTGDRYNLLDPAGGTCSPDNLRACIQKGCTVTLEDASGNPGAVYGVEGAETQSYQMNHPGLCTNTDTSKYKLVTSTAPTGVVSKIDRLRIFCPSTVVCPPETGSAIDEISTKKMSMTCTINSATSTEFCQPTALNDPGMPIDVKGYTDKVNWFYSMLLFEATGGRAIFRTLEQAKAYDAARLTLDDLVSINDHDTNSSNPLGNPDGRGWKYYFNHGEPNASPADTVTLRGTNYHIYRSDERVASTTGVGNGCAFWNTMQLAIPLDSVNAATECPKTTPCKAGKSVVSYLYGANPATGEVCLPVNNTVQRVQQSETLVPPHMGKLVAYLSKNQVSFGLTTVRIPQGGSNIALGQPQDISQLQEWLPVDRRMHDCRHSDKNGSAPTTCQ